uniref:MD-2-related lipid-recognition domain-containing protein n=1 Tax=Drosophila melanogaster TaxID=7227 RepID=Q9W165_DROME|nr:uncharacterized protein Dmel_CG13590 [Drosophila melanogaster]AAF47212.1 uncharacterized protein Dmel_CG13590 [Drosophila melanogaster]|eukprot:NP_611919.1 uncharacterized protein Dmel_CG13590 [Drosophila melanogaster]
MDHKVFIFAVSLLVAYLSCGEAPYLKMTNAVCKSYNKSWVVVHYCRLKAYSRAKTSLNINVTFVEPARNISVHFKTMKKANGYKPFLFDYTFDACEFMRRRNQPVAKIIWYMIRNVSTINHTCPYEGLQMLSDFHKVDIPVPLPSGDYLLMVDWLFDGKTQFATNVYFTFIEDLLPTSSKHRRGSKEFPVLRN